MPELEKEASALKDTLAESNLIDVVKLVVFQFV